MNPNEKPVVTFGTLMGWSDRGDYGVCAGLLDVKGHPRLGHQMQVLTSQVVGIKYDDNRQVMEIETLNTIYRHHAGGEADAENVAEEALDAPALV